MKRLWCRLALFALRRLSAPIPHTATSPGDWLALCGKAYAQGFDVGSRERETELIAAYRDRNKWRNRAIGVDRTVA